MWRRSQPYNPLFVSEMILPVSYVNSGRGLVCQTLILSMQVVCSLQKLWGCPHMVRREKVMRQMARWTNCQPYDKLNNIDRRTCETLDR
jgi:hypothetical protein